MLRIAYGSLVIAARCADAAPLAWLAEFLGAAFDPASPSAPSDHTLTLELGPLPPPAAGPVEPVECFSLDGEFVVLPARRGPHGSLAIRDDAQGISYDVRDRDVTILASADGPAARLALLRVTRELATAHAFRLGHLHLHAAAAVAAGHIVALAGPRRSGKTTLLLHLLLGGGMTYVTNDRLLVDVGRCVARGMPTIVSLREDTLGRFPDFARRLRESGYARARTIAETRDPAGWRPTVSPAQLRALAGVGEAGPGALGAVVFPSLAGDVPTFEIRALDAGEAAARLRRGLLLATLPERPAAAFAAGTSPRGGGELDRLCRELAARVPCLEARLGPRAYEGPAVRDAILEHVR